MKKAEFAALDKYYREVRDTRDQISALEGLIRAIEYRAKSQNYKGYLRISIYRDHGYTGGSHGWYGRILVSICREAILPQLRASLKELRAAYRAMPPLKKEASDAE